ncbi:amidohydrolase family protein [Pseudonocardia kujensis]|uniref:amidohydrolase family protein n=1 Tax=Pseudonocardia kujensis TaxID=1128675 RepID=UPI001E5E7383|nr:amidohydrolase family protein [Pseudonocardia kujensis]MCE0766031.1 amidohydrolase family protein [Pseudonocardia kujensis]
MRIIDAHHHLWDLGALSYPWLTTDIQPKSYGDYAAIRRNYLVADFLADVDSAGVTKSVHLAAGATDVFAETSWLEGIANDADRSRGFPHAIVAAADLTVDSVEEGLERHAALSERLRGVRQILSTVVTAGHADPSVDPAWAAGVGLLAKHDLSLDLQVHPTQLDLAVELARDNPELLVILDHCALVDHKDPAGLALWRRGVTALAALPNVRMKLSAFMLYDLEFTADSIRPIVQELIELFGVDRAFFASNFPVDRLACSYAELWRRYRSSIEDLTADERDRLLYRTAAATYRIPE